MNTLENVNDFNTQEKDKTGSLNNSFAQMLAEYDYAQPQLGEIVQGEVLKVDDVVLINVGANRDAIVPHEEVSSLDEKFLNGISQGDEIPVYVTRVPRNGSEEIFVSIEKGLQEQDWKRAQTLLDADEIIEVEIIGFNKGGVLAELGRLQGFIPNSRIPNLRNCRNYNQRMKLKQEMVGNPISVKVIDATQNEQRLVFAADAAAKIENRKFLESLQEESVIEGTVRNLVKYGAFVDIGGVNGLLHISNISWKRIQHPSEELEVGQTIEVMIEEVDVEQERVSLNHKILKPSPWEAFTEEFGMHDIVEGTVTDLVEFGAFVTLPFGLIGLIHISELSSDFVDEIDEVVEVGDVVKTRIIAMNPNDERVGLSLRQAELLQ